MVRQLRQLHEPRSRREQGLLLLEGTHLLQEALRLGLQPQLVLATPAWIAAHPVLVASLPAPVRLQPASEAVLEATATTRHPDGVLLTLPAPAPPLGNAHAAPPSFVLALDRLQDPGNLGTVLRTALAAGVDEVWLADGADPHQPKVLRSSAGAALALPLHRLQGAELAARLRELRERGMQVVATAARARRGEPPPRPYWQLAWRRPTLRLRGNDGAGLAPALAELASEVVTIPHSPAVESLNVAVAAAPLLLERGRQRLQRGDPPGASSRGG
ncbi:MAG: TrmH family RNA methyltransferase [Synechococcaceae cyanobacterium]